MRRGGTTARRTPLDQLRERVKGVPGVGAIYVLDEGYGPHMWVLLRQWSREVEYRVYDVQEEADPTYRVHLHIRPEGSFVPPSAVPVR